MDYSEISFLISVFWDFMETSVNMNFENRIVLCTQ